MTTHRQCELKHVSGRTQVSFIPKEFADVGHPVRLKENGVWEDGWKVTEAWGFEVAQEVLQERSRDHMTHRRATDV